VSHVRAAKVEGSAPIASSTRLSNIRGTKRARGTGRCTGADQLRGVACMWVLRLKVEREARTVASSVAALPECCCRRRVVRVRTCTPCEPALLPDG
jgi:hypothetical protein